MKRTVDTEKYFTTPSLARECMDFLGHVLGPKFSSHTLFIEPSVGEGAFFDLLPTDRRIGIDIEPSTPNTTTADFLTWEPPATTGSIAVIGNPPFGRYGTTAMQFINHAASFADTIAFILPRSFNKWTFQNRMPEHFHLLNSFDCQGFYRDGKPYAVKTVFQVWEKRPEVREPINPPASHPHFEMKHAHLSRVTEERLNDLRTNYEFVIPQVGRHFKPKDAAAVTKGSQWFIRPLTDGVRDRFESLDFGFLDGMNTAHTSLSKRDIVAAYTTRLEQG
jgi:hypothetical protein